MHDFIIMQDSFLLYVQVEDKDSTTSCDGFWGWRCSTRTTYTRVNDFFISKVLSLNSSFTDPESFPGEFNDGSIQLSLRVQCDAGFIGDNCTSMP